MKEEALISVIKVIDSIIFARDPYTALHQQRVAEIAGAIAREMGLSSDRVLAIRMAAAIHDVGKIAVPVAILSKPGYLTDLEMSMIKRHPEKGYDILKPINLPGRIDIIILQHHERINGSGYPFGLKGAQILVESRILGVADVFEAMCSHRPYRPALSLDLPREELYKKRGLLYDSEAVDACLKIFKTGLVDLENAPEAKAPPLEHKVDFMGDFRDFPVFWTSEYNRDQCFHC